MDAVSTLLKAARRALRGAVCLSLLCSCRNPLSPNVTRQASGNPFNGQSFFAAEPLFFEKAKVSILVKKAELPPFDSAEYRHEMTAEEQEAMNQEYLKTLTELAQQNAFSILPTSQAGDAPFVINAMLTKITVPECNPTAESRVFIGNRDGSPIDEFELKTLSLCGPTLFVKNDPFEIGLGHDQAKRTVTYLVDRIGGKTNSVSTRKTKRQR